MIHSCNHRWSFPICPQGRRNAVLNIRIVNLQTNTIMGRQSRRVCLIMKDLKIILGIIE